MDKSKIKQLADYTVRQSCENSENCYWSVSYDELYHHFGAEVTDSNESAKLLEKELRQREEINELIMTEDCIEMTCHLRYCPQCKSDPLSLLSAVTSMTTTKPNTTMSLRTNPPTRTKRRLCLCKGERNMKKTTFNISFDEDKASALVLYLSQKGTTAEAELEKALDTLYSKTVPAGVRDFIDMKSGTVSSSAVPKERKPKLPKTEHTEVSEVSANESH